MSDLPLESAHLGWLLGTWEGFGLADYPTITSCRFHQRVQFTNDGQGFLSYFSRSWQIDDDGNEVRPLATESGFWRPLPDNGVEVLLSHPTGYSEVYLGTVVVAGIENARITRTSLELKTEVVARTETAKPYTAGHRMYGLVEGDLLWTFDMAAMDHSMSNHVSARLRPAAVNGDPT